MAVVCLMALEDGRSFRVENPLRSYLGSLPSCRALASDPSVSFVRCDSCMLGSSRYKPTGFLTNIPQAEHFLGRRCRGGDEKGGHVATEELQRTIDACYAEVGGSLAGAM